MNQNTISIIVPAYNVAPQLEKTIRSIREQTWRELQIIVVNDGSTDDTGVILDRIAAEDSRILAIHKENGGVTSARLRGVAEAKGEWIGFVDGDDFVEPQMYERLLENARKYDADISHCGYRMVFPNRVDYYYNTGRLVEQDHDAGLKDLVEGRFVEPGLVIKLYRRTLFDGLTGKMDPSIRINEDVLMNYHLFKAARKSVYEDVCPYYYILRSGSAMISGLNEHKLRDPLRVSRSIFHNADEKLRPTALARLARQLIGGASMGTADQPELIKPHRKECRRELRQRLLPILRCAAAGKKLKLMALFTAVCPWGYGLVHQLYARIRGLDKFYDIH